MNAAMALREARAAGVEVATDGANLLLQAASAPPPGILELLSSNKDSLIELLSARRQGSTPGDAWEQGVERLLSGEPPRGLGVARYRTLCADAVGFMKSWSQTAAALGWDTMSLFAAHRDAPSARLECIGLICFLDRRQILDLTPTAAALETLTGARQTFGRPGVDAGWIPIWELVGER